GYTPLLDHEGLRLRVRRWMLESSRSCESPLLPVTVCEIILQTTLDNKIALCAMKSFSKPQYGSKSLSKDKGQSPGATPGDELQCEKHRLRVVEEGWVSG